MSSEQTHKHKDSRSFLYMLLVLAVAAIGIVFIWQNNQVKDLEKQVVALKQNQMPQKEFSSYDDCVGNGGQLLYTINGQFDACLGGEKDDGNPDTLVQNPAFLQYSAQNLPRINESKPAEKDNLVAGTEGHSEDLVAFLKQDYTGCDIGEPDKDSVTGYYRIIDEVPNRFAHMEYGCTKNNVPLKSLSHSETFIIAMKLSDKWVLLSPTNNMDEKGRPSCLLQDMFKISSKLTPKCFENTGYDNSQLKSRNYE